jgi:DNA repair photolyase
MPAQRPCYVEIGAKSVLNRVRGMPFEWSINPYRGCYHACVFCYARRTHTFLERDGINEWSSTIFVKLNAAQVLRRELAESSWRGDEVALGTATDPYQPAEGTYRITRAILVELARARTPAHIVTRSPLVVRDVDVLQELSRAAGVSVWFSIPTIDVELARSIEPTVAPPAQRLRALETLATAGVLHLEEVARESYFSFLQEHQPELVQRYEQLYGTKYAPKAYAAEIDKRARSARAGIRFDPPPTIEPKPSLVQLSLI